MRLMSLTDNVFHGLCGRTQNVHASCILRAAEAWSRTDTPAMAHGTCGS
jgi:hypothetical protein